MSEPLHTTATRGMSRTHAARAIVFLAWLLALAPSGCGKSPLPEDQTRPMPPPRVIGQTPPKLTAPVFIISCDTLRADHLGCYGYGRNTSPNLDAFAQDAVLFANAYTPEVWTLTAHMTMLTGLNPEQHGVTPNLNLSENIPTLPERLRDAGYATGGFVGHAWWLKGSRGFARGFDRYDVPEDYRTIEETHRLAVESWLVNQRGKPVFLFLHNYDIHSKPAPNGEAPVVLPYDAENEDAGIFTKGQTAPSFQRADHPDALATQFLAAHNNGLLEVSAEEQAYLVDAYDDCVAKVDRALGGFFSLLRAMPYLGADSFYDQALIIVTADHGESLGDHGKHIHGNVYEENVRVPLLVKFPKQEHAGAIVENLVGLADLAPTVLDVLDLPPLENTDGVSLAKALSGNAPQERTLFTRRGSWRGVLAGQHKWIRELGTGFGAGYDLAADPLERNPLTLEANSSYAAIQQAMAAYYFPPRYGWQIEMNDTTGELRVDFTITTTAELVSVQAAAGHFVEETRTLDGDRHTSGGRFEFTPTYTSDTLVVQTAPPGAPITVSLESNRPMVNAQTPEAAPSTTIVLELDRGTLVEASPASKDQPYVRVTYRAEPRDAAGVEMSGEEAAALEALGYLEGGK